MSGCGCSEENFEGPWWRYPPLRNALLAGLLALAAYILARTGNVSNATENLLYWIAIPIGGYLWAKEGIEGLWKEHEIGISILMLAATAGAGILGLWEEAVALVVLYGIAEGIEEFTFARTRTAIRALLDLAPKEARLLRDSEEYMIPAERLGLGDLFLIKPGESIPTDGVIVSGASSLNESAITGESVPVEKQAGMQVFAASINGESVLTVKVTARFADNTLSRIITLVEEAQDQKGRAQQWMERFGRRYSPVVLATALLMVLIPFLTAADLSWWSERAVVLLVAAAPCALIISLPIAMAAGIAGAGKRGILIKGGAHLEHLGMIKIIAFDKTGTLTHGRPRVTDVIPLGKDEQTLLAIAAAIEQSSQHPLAKAVIDHARQLGIDPVALEGFSSITGSGARARYEGEDWYIGNPRLFRELTNELAVDDEAVQALQSAGKTVMVVGSSNELAGLIAVQDTLRDAAGHVIQRLHDMGIRTVMLTGDNPRTAKQVADQLGIDDVRASLKPDEKVAAIKSLLRDGEVLMVGDGVNDAPALATATCGMAMGAAGSDAAIEAADVALMADDLGKLEEALFLGRKARRVSIQNIVFALLVLLVLIPAGVSGYMSIAAAVLAHEASELLAVANGLRAGRIRSAA